ncbi:sulfatase, partial [Candidatus Hydrogenedentota bacterium]
MKTSRRGFLKTVGGTVAGGALGTHIGCATSTERVKRDRPINLLFLMCDQHRHNALSCQDDPLAITPVLDKLAASGTLFEQAYCQDPVCVPSRNSILLGRYAHSTGVRSNGGQSTRDLPSFMQVLRGNGYKTACFGKLHVNGRTDLDWDVYNPQKDWPPAEIEPGKTPIGGSLLGGQPLGQPAPFPEHGHMEWRAKEQTIEFLKENKDIPWAIQCSFTKPHPAFQPPKRHWNMINRDSVEIPEYPKDDLDDTNPRNARFLKQRKLEKPTRDDILDAIQGYYGNVAFCDELFGEVLASLDELGLRGNTLIVYTADHGEMLYAHRLWTKFCFFEESVHVPLILSMPGTIPAGKLDDALVEQIDLFPT